MEQFLTPNGFHVSPWFQFRCRPFAKHITTAKPPKFHKALINIVTVRVDHAPYQVPDSDPVTDLTTHSTNRTLQNAAFQFMTNITPQQLCPILLKVPYRTNQHHFYQPITTTMMLPNFSSTGYPYIMISHPSNNELTLGRVYTRDIITLQLYV